MNYLLIDDLAEKGWKSIIQKAVIKEGNVLTTATNFQDAIQKLEIEWDIIFLDIRLTEEDHNSSEFENFSGFKLLKHIRNDFYTLNFCTPIILISASTKIWNINAFTEHGVDGFYLKEHPDLKFPAKTSRDNLENLQITFRNLTEIGQKKREVWNLCFNIYSQILQHNYFKTQEPKQQNIKDRILDKLKLGYSQLFRFQHKYETSLLLASNEALSFLIFWSILEEISKGFSQFNETWDAQFKRLPNWKFKNAEYFLNFQDDYLTINYTRSNDGNISNKPRNINKYQPEFDRYSGTSPEPLSEQIYSLLSAYCPDKADFSKMCKDFKSINKYRNETDFIHSSALNIFTKPLIEKKALADAYDKNIEVLKFILSILKFKL
jgi:CheY-like chemotaxis protein